MQSERQPADATAPNDTRTRVKHVRRLGQVTQLTPEQRDRLGPVEARYVFRANDYYLGLIDWDDPEDPIRQLIIPREEELSEWGTLDASNEESDAPRRTQQVLASVVRTARQRHVDLDDLFTSLLRVPRSMVPAAFRLPML